MLYHVVNQSVAYCNRQKVPDVIDFRLTKNIFKCGFHLSLHYKPIAYYCCDLEPNHCAI